MYERANAVSYNSRQLDKYQPNDHRNFRSWFDSMNEIISQPNPVIRFESINPRSDNPDHDNLIKLLKLPVHTHRMRKWRHSPRVSHVCDDDRHCECGDSKHTSKLNIKKKTKQFRIEACAVAPLRLRHRHQLDVCAVMYVCVVIATLHSRLPQYSILSMRTWEYANSAWQGGIENRQIRRSIRDACIRKMAKS